MVCSNHSHENGVNTCSRCGEWLCEDCSVDINGRIFCKTCISKKMSDTGSALPVTSSPPKARQPVNWLLLFIFSWILPGLNYMYMGLMKRGLFFLTSFFSITFVIAVTRIGLLGLLIPILWITCVFDGFEKRRRINSGAYVADNVDDILGWFAKYKAPVVIAALVVLAFGVFSNFTHYVFRGRHTHELVALVVVCVGGYFIVKAIGAKKTHKDQTDQGKGKE